MILYEDIETTGSGGFRYIPHYSSKSIHTPVEYYSENTTVYASYLSSLEVVGYAVTKTEFKTVIEMHLAG